MVKKREKEKISEWMLVAITLSLLFPIIFPPKKKNPHEKKKEAKRMTR